MRVTILRRKWVETSAEGVVTQSLREGHCNTEDRGVLSGKSFLVARKKLSKQENEASP